MTQLDLKSRHSAELPIDENFNLVLAGVPTELSVDHNPNHDIDPETLDESFGLEVENDDSIKRIRRCIGRIGTRGSVVIEEDPIKIEISKINRHKCAIELASAHSRDDRVQSLVSGCMDATWAKAVAGQDGLRSMNKSQCDAMSTFKVLTKTEEKHLLSVFDSGLRMCANSGGSLKEDYDKKEAQNLAAARQVLTVSNMRFVYLKARKAYHFDNSVGLEDLVHEGMLGLDEAISKYDLSKGFRLLTYAGSYIRRNISMAYAEYGRTVKLPREKHELYSKLGEKIYELESALGRVATPPEISSHLGISIDEYRGILTFGPGVQSGNVRKHNQFDEQLSELVEFVTDESQYQLDDLVDSYADIEIVSTILDSADLDDKAKMLLGLVFETDLFRDQVLFATRVDNHEPIDYQGLINRLKLGEDVSVSEISKAFGVSARALRATRSRILAKLKETATSISVDIKDLSFESV